MATDHRICFLLKRYFNFIFHIILFFQFSNCVEIISLKSQSVRIQNNIINFIYSLFSDFLSFYFFQLNSDRRLILNDDSEFLVGLSPQRTRVLTHN